MNSVLLAKGHILGDQGGDSEDEEKVETGEKKFDEDRSHGLLVTTGAHDGLLVTEKSCSP